MNNSKVFEKPFIFITGAPRSGTSLVTKIIGAHPDIAMIMEHIFENRRRHWHKADFWNDRDQLRSKVYEFYQRFDEPILGNKVCTPDVWSFEEIDIFCSLFSQKKILFVVRDPRAVVISRYKREEPNTHFNEVAKSKLSLDFSSRTRTFISSWDQSISVYNKIKFKYGINAMVVYYEDLTSDFRSVVSSIFKFLEIEIEESVFEWYKLLHYNANGVKVKDLKYLDERVTLKKMNIEDLPDDFTMTKNESLNYQKFLNREL